VAQPTSGELILVRGDGAAANPIQIQIQPQAVPPPQPAAVPAAPGAPEVDKPRTF
jgi:hypothetical protein